MLRRPIPVGLSTLTRAAAVRRPNLTAVLGSSARNSGYLSTRPNNGNSSNGNKRRISTTSTAPHRMTSFYDLKAELPGRKVFDFADLRGKVVLIVNVASGCGFTVQYKGLQQLYEKYKDEGLVVLGFPTNQFIQEPGDDAEIRDFCSLNFGVTFPLMRKSDVNGDNANEVFKWLKNKKAGLLGLSRIKWNFEKFLVDKSGNVVNRWASTSTPDSIEPEIVKHINAAD